MEGVKKFLYIIFGLLSFLLVTITMFVILVQHQMEVNIILTTFCAVSWILFIFAAFQVLNLETEEKEIIWKIETLAELEKAELLKNILEK